MALGGAAARDHSAHELALHVAGGVHRLVVSTLLAGESHLDEGRVAQQVLTLRRRDLSSLLPEPLLLFGPKGARGTKLPSGGFLSSRQHSEDQQPLLSGALTLLQHTQSPVHLPGNSPGDEVKNINLAGPAG